MSASSGSGRPRKITGFARSGTGSVPVPSDVTHCEPTGRVTT
ncbi:hypothetical protein [Streptomyces sp. STR69]|nr:hypothetical protein [Streptomyces sp. STR69]